MRIGDYLTNHQPLLYHTFVNALKEGRVSHAYLLSGEAGVPLLETATYLAKSLVCEHKNPLACEECSTCERIDHGNYPDLVILDGKKDSIKKDDIGEVMDGFARTPLEKKGVMIYIINDIENMTTEAINSLLKFLEEPGPKTYAFLTTENEAKVLPTIKSRCEVMRMLLLPRAEVIQMATEEAIPLQDAEILSYFCNSPDLIKLESQTEEYQGAKRSFENALEALAKKHDECVFQFEHSVAVGLTKKEAARYFLDMLSLAYKDLVALQKGQKPLLSTYATLMKPLEEKVVDPSRDLVEIMKIRGQLDLNISSLLLLDHLALYLTKEF
jgi:DNA polymerase-3 subunit delta'